PSDVAASAGNRAEREYGMTSSHNQGRDSELFVFTDTDELEYGDKLSSDGSGDPEDARQLLRRARRGLPAASRHRKAPRGSRRRPPPRQRRQRLRKKELPRGYKVPYGSRSPACETVTSSPAVTDSAPLSPLGAPLTGLRVAILFPRLPALFAPETTKPPR